MKRKRCCFAGHSKIYDSKIREKLLKHIIMLIEEENVKDFWVGNYGKFDEYSSSILMELKKTYDDIKIELIIPYFREKASEHMVNKSDYIICYVEHSWGGAAKTYEYARRQKHIQIINIADN